MANANSPRGLVPVKNADGSAWNGQTVMYYCAATNSQAMYRGDPVILAGSADPNGVATIQLASTGTSARITGAIVGWVPSPTILANGHRLASTAEYALVAAGPNLVYEVQEDGTLALASVGLNIDLTAGSGSNVTGWSGYQAKTSTASSGATHQMRILGFSQVTDNTAASANSKLLLRINLPTETGAAGSTGV